MGGWMRGDGGWTYHHKNHWGHKPQTHKHSTVQTKPASYSFPPRTTWPLSSSIKSKAFLFVRIRHEMQQLPAADDGFNFINNIILFDRLCSPFLSRTTLLPTNVQFVPLKHHRLCKSVFSINRPRHKQIDWNGGRSSALRSWTDCIRKLCKQGSQRSVRQLSNQQI